MADSSRFRPAGRFSRAAGLSLAFLFGIAAVAVVVAAVAWTDKPNTLEYELAKIAMQVVAVAVLGGLATIATAIFQESFKREATRQDALVEQRRKQDDLLRELLDETLTAYNRVKRVRRLLAAHTADGTGRITLDVYDEHMSTLIDQQLEFEKIKRRSPFIDDARLRSTALPGASVLTDGYEKIEKYLNRVIDEYESNRASVVSARHGLPVCRFDKLAGFIGDAFKAGAADRIDEIITALQGATVQPIATAREG
jgi:hypothetical protein